MQGTGNGMGEKVTVYTQVYNTKAYLEQCISSVLSQTYTNFEYILVDNGCTDGSSEILEKYAKQDQRINLICFEENQHNIWHHLVCEHASGSYCTVLDSDDWWEPDYLERILVFAQKNDLDITCTGTLMHVVDTGALSYRKTDISLVLPREAFAKCIPWYHAFFRTVWGKLIRMEFVKAEAGYITPVKYGGDTLLCFRFLRHAARIGIDCSVLHHYRIHKSSASYQYDSKRFEADIYLYNDAVDFLKAFGSVSDQNKGFLQAVYCNAVADTIDVIKNAAMPEADKLREYRTIARHPLTLAACRECTAQESGSRVRSAFLNAVLRAGSHLNGGGDADFQETLQVVMRVVYPAMNPDFGQFIPPARLPWYLLHAPELVTALAMKDYEGAAQFWENTSLKASEENVEMARTLAALLGNQASYVYYSKLFIELLIQTGALSLADEELAEWEEILPGDEELAALRLELEERK